MNETRSSAIHTQCPHCNTIFKINDIQLNALEGKVRCGYCYRVFNAKDMLIDELENNKTEPSKPKPSVQVNLPQPDAHALETIQQAKQELQADTLHQLDTSKPEKTSKLAPSTFLWGLAIACTVVLFISQYTYFYRDDLAQKHSQLRPILEQMCQTLGCKMPLVKAPEQFKLISHDMRLHPEKDNTLLVRGTFTNNADFSQPYPLLKLELSDLHGKTIAHRMFSPDQYLNNSPDHQAGIPPSGQIETELNIIDLGPSVVGFTLETK